MVNILWSIFIGTLLLFGIVFLVCVTVLMVIHLYDQVKQRPRVQKQQANFEKRQQEFDKRFELTQQRIDESHKRAGMWD